MDYVYGFTILNDVTARDLQANHGQWFHGKSLDTFCPMGPSCSCGTLRPIPLRSSPRSTAEVRQGRDDRTNLSYTIPQLIQTLSQGTTLLPGDIIATGTPSGVRRRFNPPKFIHSGDVVEISISDIGTLTNKVK